MPNIPPLITGMAGDQSLYASYTVSGGGGGVTNPLNGDLDAGGYNINNVANITVTTINTFPAFPSATTFGAVPTDPVNLAAYSSASYFVIRDAYDGTTLTFTYDTKAPAPLTPLAGSFWNIQNNSTTTITIQFFDGTNTNVLGTIGNIGIVGQVNIGVVTYDGSYYYFY
jgi:hypothetical protein